MKFEDAKTPLLHTFARCKMCKDRVFPQNQRPIQSPVARPFLGSGSRYDMRATAGMRDCETMEHQTGNPETSRGLQFEAFARDLPAYPKEKLVAQLKSRLDEGPKWLKGSKVTAIGGPNSMLFETNSARLSCFSMFLHPTQTFIVVDIMVSRFTMFQCVSSFWTDELEMLEVLHSFRSIGEETLQLHRNLHSAEQPHWPV